MHQQSLAKRRRGDSVFVIGSPALSRLSPINSPYLAPVSFVFAMRLPLFVLIEGPAQSAALLSACFFNALPQSHLGRRWHGRGRSHQLLILLLLITQIIERDLWLRALFFIDGHSWR